MTPAIIHRRCEQFYTDTLEHYAYLCAAAVDERWHLYMQSKGLNNIPPSHYRNFGHPAPCLLAAGLFLLAAGLLADLGETIVTIKDIFLMSYRKQRI